MEERWQISYGTDPLMENLMMIYVCILHGLYGDGMYVFFFDIPMLKCGTDILAETISLRAKRG